jgi:hypothetical protein
MRARLRAPPSPPPRGASSSSASTRSSTRWLAPDAACRAHGGAVVPGSCDPHAHVAGDRREELRRRLSATYAEIAAEAADRHRLRGDPGRRSPRHTPSADEIFAAARRAKPRAVTR